MWRVDDCCGTCCLVFSFLKSLPTPTSFNRWQQPHRESKRTKQKWKPLCLLWCIEGKEKKNNLHLLCWFPRQEDDDDELRVGATTVVWCANRRSSDSDSQEIPAGWVKAANFYTWSQRLLRERETRWGRESRTKREPARGWWWPLEWHRDGKWGIGSGSAVIQLKKRIHDQMKREESKPRKHHW